MHPLKVNMQVITYLYKGIPEGAAVLQCDSKVPYTDSVLYSLNSTYYYIITYYLMSNMYINQSRGVPTI